MVSSIGLNELKTNKQPDKNIISEVPSVYNIRIPKINYCQISNISGTLLENKIIDHSDVVGASPVGAALTTSSLWT